MHTSRFTQLSSFSMKSVPWVALAAFVMAACDATGPQTTNLTLSVTAKSTNPAPMFSAAPGVNADVPVGSGPNSLVIQSVQLVLAEIELSESDTCFPQGDDNNCNEMEFGPLFVDVPLDGTAIAVLDALVPVGSYSRLQADLEAVEADEEGATEFLENYPGFEGLSVQVTGTYTDESGEQHDFTFTSGVEAEFEVVFDSPITVDEGTSNLTFNVDVASWFVDAVGAAIDPRDAANAAAIEANIQRSFDAFEDNDRDGDDDNEVEEIS